MARQRVRRSAVRCGVSSHRAPCTQDTHAYKTHMASHTCITHALPHAARPVCGISRGESGMGSKISEIAHVASNCFTMSATFGTFARPGSSPSRQNPCCIITPSKAVTFIASSSVWPSSCTGRGIPNNSTHSRCRATAAAAPMAGEVPMHWHTPMLYRKATLPHINDAAHI